MIDISIARGPLLLLHGLMGGWDELIILAVGVLLAIFVVKWTSRSSQDEDADDEMLGTVEGVDEKRTEHS